MEPENQTREQVLDTLEGNSVTMFLAAEWMATPAGKAAGKVVECIEARALLVIRDGREVWYNLEGPIVFSEIREVARPGTTTVGLPSPRRRRCFALPSGLTRGRTSS